MVATAGKCPGASKDYGHGENRRHDDYDSLRHAWSTSIVFTL
jgi:hypothetical protein